LTLSLLTNDEVIAVDQNSVNNHQLFNTNNQVAWVADVPGTKDKYLAMFNTSPPPPPGRGRRGPAPAVELADNSAGATNRPAVAPPTREPVKISVSHWPTSASAVPPKCAISGRTRISAASPANSVPSSTRTARDFIACRPTNNSVFNFATQMKCWAAI
jgi:hypothetical protein